MAHGIIYGSYNPLSFLMRTWAESPETLVATLPLEFSKWPPKETPDDETLLGIANFIHEYTHYIQTSSRLQNLSLLGTLANQSAWTHSLATTLRQSHKHAYWPPKIPIVNWVFSNLPREVSGQWVENWMGFETINRIFWGQSFYSREEHLGEFIDDLFQQFYSTHSSRMLQLPDPMYPTIQGADESGNPTSSRILLPQDIIENEANVNVFLFISGWYGLETAFRILKQLLGSNSTQENFALAFSWIMEGIAHLFPFAADMAF